MLVEQLQYELSSESRRSQAEVAALQQRVRDLETRLIETRQEADEYMKSNIEINNQLTSLTQQVHYSRRSELKLISVSVALCCMNAVICDYFRFHTKSLTWQTPHRQSTLVLRLLPVCLLSQVF